MPSKTTLFLISFLVALLAISINESIIEVRFSPKKLSQTIKKRFSSFNRRQQESTTTTASTQDAPTLLKEHSKLFEKKEILKVTDNVYSAIGFGLANSLLFDDPTSEEGLVMIDAMESEEAMQEVLDAYQKEYPEIFVSRDEKKKKRGIPRKVNTLIYTHFHQDHTMGGRVVNATRIVAFEQTRKMLTHSPVTGPITYRRGMRQFGVFSPTESFVNSGIGPELRTGENVPHKNRGDDADADASTTSSSTSSYTSRPMLPTETFSTPTHKLKIGNNLEMTVIHCSGETADQIVIHVPKIDLLVASDNIYQSFPNIYAIRGTPSRDATLWAQCVGNTMRGLRSKILVPLHTRPVFGEEKIFKLLTDYRDAIQYVHDQTVFYMNRGLFPSQIVQKLKKLPKHLHDHPWLQPFYGNHPSAAVRSVFSHYLGWFGGDAKELSPSAPGSFAREIVTKLAKPEEILVRVKELLSLSESENKNNNNIDERREYAQLALELVSLILEVNPSSSAQKIDANILTEAQSLRTKCYAKLASLTLSTNERNYYTTYALEQDGELDLHLPLSLMRTGLNAVESGTHILQAMAVNLDAEITADADWLVRFEFSDTKEKFLVHVRNSVVDIFEEDKKSQLLWDGADRVPDLDIVTSLKTWIQLMTKERSPVALLASKEIEIRHGSMMEMTKLRTFFSNPRDYRE